MAEYLVNTSGDQDSFIQKNSIFISSVNDDQIEFLKIKDSQDFNTSYQIERQNNLFESAQEIQNIQQECLNQIDQKGNEQKENIHSSTPYLDQQVACKKKKNQKQKGLKYQEVLFRKNKQINSLAQQLSMQKNFYLFLDQVIDLEILKNIDNKEEYFLQNQQIHIYQGLRFINKVEHRLDNKFIELNMQNQEQKEYQMNYFIDYLKSLGNANLLSYISKLQSFQISIERTQKLIHEQIQNPLFKQHRERRKEDAQRCFQKITSKLDGNKLLLYSRLSVNYEKQNIDSDVCGYSPSLYSVLSQDSYTFQNQISQHGYFDIFQMAKRIDTCMEGAIRYLNAPPQTSIQATKNHYQELEIATCDGFNFVGELNISRYILDEEYDKQNNLEFKFKDILNVYEFKFKDQLVYNQFLQFRQEQLLGRHNPDFIDQIFYSQDCSYKNTQFFKEYYENQEEDLTQKGSKWFKRCGFVDIPKKKKKGNIQNISNTNYSQKSTDSLNLDS